MARSGRVIKREDYEVVPFPSQHHAAGSDAPSSAVITRQWILWTCAVFLIIVVCGSISAITSGHVLGQDVSSTAEIPSVIPEEAVSGHLSEVDDGKGGRVVEFKFHTSVGKKAAKAGPPPSSGYIGSGYDIFFGNPEGTLDGKPDNGFRKTVAALNYTGAKPCSSLLGHTCPAQGAVFEQLHSCSIPKHASVLNTMHRYTEKLFSDVTDALSKNVEGQMAHAAAFQASAQYAEAKVQIEEEFQKVFWMEALCLVYAGEMNPSLQSPLTAPAGTSEKDMLQLSPDFLKAANGLPAKFPPCQQASAPAGLERAMQCPSDHKKYVNMIKNFGTHWTRAVAFGNKETLRAVFSNDQLRKMIAANGRKAVDKLLSSYMRADSEGSSDETRPKDLSRLYVGNLVSANGASDWQLDAEEDPQPVQYTVTPIWDLLPEPKRTNFLNAVRTYAGELGLSPGSGGALESHQQGHYGPTVIYHGASCHTTGPFAASHFLQRPGWNTVSTFMFYMPTGWTGSPIITLVDLSETATNEALVNTEFRVMHGVSSTGGNIGVAGISGIPKRPRGVHFHDVLQIPDWSKLRLRLQANSHYVLAHRGMNITTKPTVDAKAEFSAFAVPEYADWRITFLQVPSNTIRSLLWNNTWCVLTNPTWGPSMPRMRMEGYDECVKGHVLLFLVHISRVQQMDGDAQTFGIRLMWDDQLVAISFTGNVMHKNFSEFSMHAVLPCRSLDDKEHDLEVQFVADSSLALANTEAARQTRRLTTLLVAKKHIFNHRWVLTEREHILPNDVWTSLPTPMKVHFEVPETDMSVSVVVWADISQISTSGSLELRSVIDGQIQGGYYRLSEDSPLPKGLSFHGVVDNVNAGSHTVEVQYRTLENKAAHFPVGDYHGVHTQERRLTAMIINGGKVNMHLGSDDLALGAQSRQSSTYVDADASRAIDGNAMPWFGEGSVSQTKAEPTAPWWEVDLSSEHIIAQIEVRTSIDKDMWPGEFDVLIFDQDHNKIWAQHVVQASETMNFKVPYKTGRWVRIQMRKPGALALSEILVFPPQ